MGGRGSGRVWYGGAGSAGGKDTTEEHHSVDIRWLKKRRCLVPGFSGSLSWSTTRNGATRRTGSISYRMESDSMILIYRCRVNRDEWQDVEEVIRFDRTACYFGGFRKWFRCPECGRRVAVIYLAGKYFLCRHCHDLCYTSQQEREIDRMIRKQRKIRKRLKVSNDLATSIWKKPKGMHQKTFNRLRHKDEKIGMYKWELIGEKVGVLQSHLELIKDRFGMKG
jgi:hypothetical protein